MNERILGFIEGLIAGVSFGTASIFVRYLVILDVNIYAIAFFRLIIASIFLLFVSSFIINRKSMVLFVKPDILKWIILMGILIGLHFIFFIAAVRDTYIVNATVLVNTTPILALILGYFLFGITFFKRDLFAIFLAFIGSVLLVLHDFRLEANIVGDIEALIAAFLIAIYINVGRKVRVDGNILGNMAIVYLVASPIVYLVSLLSNIPLLNIEYSLYSISLLILIGLVPTGIGHTLYVSSLRGLKPYEASTLALLEPVSATILAYILFSESPGIFSLLGATMVLMSIIIFSYTRRFE
jgi:drug/metabolite transporter (DMT)-like permease